jgi:hypothetical protein
MNARIAPPQNHSAALRLRFVQLMEDWADWFNGYDPRLGFSPKCAGLQNGRVSSDFDELMAGVDKRVFQIIEAKIDDLPVMERAAVQKRYRLCTIWRFPRNNYEDMLQKGHERILDHLLAKGVVI